MDQEIAWLQSCAVAGWPREACGYMASGLVLATFSMQSMRKLRVAAIASNFAFILYAVIANLHPILLLHCVLLPLNVIRLLQIELGSCVSKRSRDAAAWLSTALADARRSRARRIIVCGERRRGAAALIDAHRRLAETQIRRVS